ncbi:MULTISPECIES: hypothetical protein [unclassified Crossiella]|uniref:hypothetical protein n=1 Tax=unclassified Crossiella TaxID=2620835 RepID=UPI001FFE9076|nr:MULTISPECIES: hypothetical protein [unclassified Crossiella]MCK2254581.1 hypothetical protein [Crossiella sp. S99.1]
MENGREVAHRARKDHVNATVRGVKESSGPVSGLNPACTLAPVVELPSREGSAQMADLAYAVLLIGGFLVLALTLRGLERL